MTSHLRPFFGILRAELQGLQALLNQQAVSCSLKPGVSHQICSPDALYGKQLLRRSLKGLLSLSELAAHLGIFFRLKFACNFDLKFSDCLWTKFTANDRRARCKPSVQEIASGRQHIPTVLDDEPDGELNDKPNGELSYELNHSDTQSQSLAFA